jgi:hypothetical protein
VFFHLNSIFHADKVCCKCSGRDEVAKRFSGWRFKLHGFNRLKLYPMKENMDCYTKTARSMLHLPLEAHTAKFAKFLGTVDSSRMRKYSIILNGSKFLPIFDWFAPP